MDQGVINASKALYVRNLMQHLVDVTDGSDNLPLKAYWQQFPIATCLEQIQSALHDMKADTVRAGWRNPWPHDMHAHGATPQASTQAVVDEAICLAKRLGEDGFTDMNHDDIDELLDSDSVSLSDGELMESSELTIEEADGEKVSGREAEEVGLTLERPAKITRIIKEAQDRISEWDPDLLRAFRFRNALDSAIAPYRNDLDQMKKERRQLPITMFFEKASGHQSTQDTSVPDESTCSEIVVSDDD